MFRYLASVALCMGIGFGSTPPATGQLYELLEGSQLTEDCLFCDRLPIVVPLSGRFQLHVVNSNPLFTEYEVSDLSLHGGTTNSLQYDVTGTGAFRIGGEVAVTQEMFLDAAIKNWFTNTAALLVNPQRMVQAVWPRIQITLQQTNGTPMQTYYLDLIAAPVPVMRSIIADPVSGDVLLAWENYGAQVQLERALAPKGPYSPVTPPTTESSFTDVGALGKHNQLFYRVRLL